ncbi:hypothetical protein K435DRAFT_844066 [Dendrothele bispora CBS 962.96]|uniref:F-box domain-containing protein n=1 Tax=Dendrothele bispora (strain CBS 962.96) TaxID=1314807 RepID=A0A4S8L4T1_DENBC|nr:hypothetical protein K435DRAFT_844066 [Dendrothele bispora CBS 962.96]
MTDLFNASILPGELWERISFHSLACEDSFLGPPSGICSILLTCRWLYQCLSMQNNPGFYTRLFRFKFDYDAPLRRLGTQWLTTRHFSAELKKRMETLKRVRRREEPYSVQDLWTCFLMMSENDGRNERQLIEWARIYPYLQRATSMRFESEPNSSANWFSGSQGTALILWLWWMIFSREDLRVENQHIRDVLIRKLLHTFLVKGFQYSSCYGPESHFHLPLPHVHDSIDSDLEPDGSDTQSQPQAWSTAPLPNTSKIVHYTHPLMIASPLMNPGALLLWITRMETFLEGKDPIVGPLAELPLNRAEANARNLNAGGPVALGPTQEDVIRRHKNQVHAPERCKLNVKMGYDEEEDFCLPEHRHSDLNPKTTDSPCSDDNGNSSGSGGNRVGSRRYDEDWYRMVSCSDPWSTKSMLRGPVHRPGSLTGSWAGTFLQISHDVHIDLLTRPHLYPPPRPNTPSSSSSPPSQSPSQSSPQSPPSQSPQTRSRTIDNIGIFRFPLYFNLREHHCLHPDEPLEIGVDGLGEDHLLNAWLPEGIKVKETDGAVYVTSPNSNKTIRYETYVPGAASSSLTSSCSPGGAGARTWVFEEEFSTEEMDVDADEEEDEEDDGEDSDNDIAETEPEPESESEGDSCNDDDAEDDDVTSDTNSDRDENDADKFWRPQQRELRRRRRRKSASAGTTDGGGGGDDQRGKDTEGTSRKGRSTVLSGRDRQHGQRSDGDIVSGLGGEDSKEQYTPTVTHLDSGIADILVTGETGEAEGSAWGHYNLIGRVRPWDGFIVLLRTPKDHQNSGLGRWIFRGYVHDRNLVGRWRETATGVRDIGYEGPFVAKLEPRAES